MEQESRVIFYRSKSVSVKTGLDRRMHPANEGPMCLVNMIVRIVGEAKVWLSQQIGFTLGSESV